MSILWVKSQSDLSVYWLLYDNIPNNIFIKNCFRQPLNIENVTELMKKKQRRFAIHLYTIGGMFIVLYKYINFYLRRFWMCRVFFFYFSARSHKMKSCQWMITNTYSWFVQNTQQKRTKQITNRIRIRISMKIASRHTKWNRLTFHASQLLFAYYMKIRTIKWSMQWLEERQIE